MSFEKGVAEILREGGGGVVVWVLPEPLVFLGFVTAIILLGKE